MDSNKDDILQENEERITRYLHGEMTPDEETLFEKDIQSDETLRNQTEAIARTIKAMNALGSEQDRKLVEEMRGSSKKKTRPTRWLSIAASFALLITVGYYTYDYSSTVSLGKEYATAFPLSTEIRGEEDDVVLNKLTVLFDYVACNRDIDNTIVQLEELWQQSQSDTYNEYTTYAPYIGWNLAISYLLDYDKKKAKSVLEQMEQEYPSTTEMRGLIEKLLKRIQTKI